MTLVKSDNPNPSLVDKPPTLARRRVSATLEDMPIPDSPPLPPRRLKSCERSPVERQYSPESLMSDLTDDLSDFCSSNSEKRSSFTREQLERGLRYQSQKLDATPLQRWSGSSSLGDTPPQRVKKRSSRMLLEVLSDLFEGDDEHEKKPQAEKETESVQTKRSVSFGNVSSVRSYERILEVHPRTSTGPSLGIGWKFVEEECTTNFVWDKTKDPTAFRLSREKRERILKDHLGYSQKDDAKAVRKGQMFKSRRPRTTNNLSESNKSLPLEEVECAIEKLSKRLNSI